MRTPIQQKFYDETHIDPDYFLQMVLEFLQLMPKEDWGQATIRNTMMINNFAKPVGFITETKHVMTIERPPK